MDLFISSIPNNNNNNNNNNNILLIIIREECRLSSFKVLIVSPIGKGPLRMPRLRWEGDIRMNLKEIDTNTRNWTDSAQDRDYWRALVNATLNLPVP